MNSASKDEIESKMPIETFSIFWMFKKEGVKDPKENAEKMQKILEKCPYWRENEKHGRIVRINLIKIILNAGMDEDQIILTADKIIKVMKGSSK